MEITNFIISTSIKDQKNNEIVKYLLNEEKDNSNDTKNEEIYTYDQERKETPEAVF